MRNFRVLWQCQIYSPNTLQRILIQFNFDFSKHWKPDSQYTYFQSEAAYFIDLPEEAAKRWVVLSPLD